MPAKVMKISMRGFAEVAAAEPKSKPSKLSKYKFPESDESVARSNYYIKALSAIKRHHRGEHAHVQKVLKDLLAEAAVETDSRKRAKLLGNHRAIIDYLKTFGNRALIIKPGKQLHFVYEDLVISARPDLVAEENGETTLIKLNLGKKTFGGGVPALLLHLLYEAAKVHDANLKPNRVECIQLADGSKISGPKNGFPPKKVLENACKEIVKIWSAA
jgi:hypothetical protein